ncbi:MAG: hypothetical protein KGI90_02400 [Burkholderiales bacterium]|nr:hypothetical protein [Burkholderiales bacterium]MDE2276261.1 hypothetical protein [Burkholderiales bacterium]
MPVRLPVLGVSLFALPLLAAAADGLVAPATDAVWPDWQARITILTPSPLSLGLAALAAAAAGPGLQGGAVFGDYVFARPWFGSFRASGGLLRGRQAGLPLASLSAGRLGVNVMGTAAWAPGIGADADVPGTYSYLGLGYNGHALHGGLSVSADFGLVSGSGARGVGRALFGSQGLNSSLRELRLSPLLQLGVRYNF